MDTVTKEHRSRIMRAVKRENTLPEINVRQVARRLGLRYRLHPKNLPGSPDLTFSQHKICLFVHGCFWHRHEGCRRATVPKSNQKYWRKKFIENVKRDKRVRRKLEAIGWLVVIIWECQAFNEHLVVKSLRRIFGLRQLAYKA